MEPAELPVLDNITNAVLLLGPAAVFVLLVRDH